MITIRKLVVLAVLITIFSAGAFAGRRNIDIVEVSQPQIVARGEEFTAEVTVKNRGDFDENVTVTGKALDQISETREKIVESREKEKFNISFTPRMRDEGPFRIDIEAESDYSYDHFTVRSKISKMEGYFNLRPENIKVNSPVRVKGRLEHTEMSKGVKHLTAELYDGDRYLGKVEIDKQGYFTTEYTPKRTGSHRLKLVKDDVLIERSIYVEPSIRISSLRMSDKIFQEKYAEKCVDVELNGVEKASLKLFDITDTEEDLVREKEIDRDEGVCLRLPTDKTGQRKGRIVVQTEDGEYSDKMDFSYTVASKRLEIDHRKEDMQYENGEVTVPVELINRKQEDVETWIKVDTDLDVLKKPSPVTIRGDSREEVELRFGGVTGEHEVDVEVTSAEDKDVKTIEVTTRTKNANFTGMISKAETTGKILIAVLLLIGLFSAGRRLLYPRALEPRY